MDTGYKRESTESSNQPYLQLQGMWVLTLPINKQTKEKENREHMEKSAAKTVLLSSQELKN